MKQKIVTPKQIRQLHILINETIIDYNIRKCTQKLKRKNGNNKHKEKWSKQLLQSIRIKEMDEYQPISKPMVINPKEMKK